MSDTKKLEEALELLLNEQDEEADKLFHQYFVSQARKINEQIEEESEDESLPYDMEDDLTSEIESDSEEVEAEEGSDEAGEETGEEEESSSESEDEEVDDRVDDLENALDELRSEFDKLMGMEEEEHDEDIDGDGQVGTTDFESDEDEMDYEDEEETLELEDDDVEESVELRQQSQHITDNKYKNENQEAGAGDGVQKNTSSGFGKKGPAKADAGPGQLHSQGGGHTGYDKEAAPSDVYGSTGEASEYNDADNVYDTSKNVNKKKGETVTDKGHKQEKELGSGGKSVNTNKQSVLRKQRNG